MSNSLTVSLDDVPALTEQGVLSSREYMKAVSFLRDGAFWKSWAVRALLAIAAGHLLSGIIFFFAFNWNDLSGMAKFAVVGAGIAASVAGWVITKLDSPLGQAFGISATVLVGVMFAVLGQVYQTPAMIHTPFVFWAALTLPFALASRNLAHWTVWLVIFTVAVSSYANSALRLAGDDVAANVLNISIASGFVLGLMLLDKIISPRFKWARAEWFRVLLVLGAVGFAFFGFTESFWEERYLWWVLALAVNAGLLAYLYFFKPSLATLALASFGIFTLAAQFGFKVFDRIGDDFSVFFIIFLWLGALTTGLVILFRHYLKRFKAAPHLTALDKNEAQAAFSRSSAEFSNHMKLNEASITDILTSDAGREQPWYMSVFLAIAGVLTALLGCVFFGSSIGMILGFSEEIVYGVLGAIIFAASIVLRRKTDSRYVQHMLNTMIIVGGIMTAFGFGLEIKNFDSIIALILVLSLIVLVSVRDSILEFLSASAIITLIGMELYHLKAPLVESFILIISTLLGVSLLTQPIQKRLYKAAGIAFLMAPALVGIALVHIQRWASLADTSRFSDDWLARAISLLVLLGAVIYLNRGKSVGDFRPPMIVLIPLLLGAACVPLGGASALLLILAGYILGSRSLAIIGTLLQIYFLTMFYYDLSLGLLTKSIILFVSGLVFLGVWFFVRETEEAAA